VRSFHQFPLLPTLLETLDGAGTRVPTPIQDRVLPALLAGRSVVGIAETGSGKTLAYVLPMLDRLKRLEEAGDRVEVAARPRGLVIVPSRELGEQVTRVIKGFAHETRIRVRTILGDTRGIFEILVATPGRLGQLVDAGELLLDDVRTLVLDEADQLVDRGFMPVIGRMVALAPAERQLALFSATVPKQVEALIAKSFRDPLVIRSEGSHKVVPTLTTRNMTVEDGKRLPVLEGILAEPTEGGTLIFANTRAQCDEIVRQLLDAGQRVGLYRGEMDRAERRANLKAFRDGTAPILVTTDVGGRGLDIPHVGRVVNYHLPQDLRNYLHRVGRTARAGRPGLVINLVTPRDRGLMEQIRASERR
jgi:superfamily II DNA/RNA helicase